MTLKYFFRYVLTLILFTVSTRAHAQYDDRPRLISFQKNRIQAMMHRDTVALSRLLANDLIFVHSSGVIDNKQSLINDINSGRIVYIYIIPEKVTATIDGNFGWIYGRANIRFKLASMTGNIDQYISFVECYRLKYNQWQLVACQNARIDNNAPYSNNTLVPQAKGSVQPGIY